MIGREKLVHPVKNKYQEFELLKTLTGSLNYNNE